MRIIFDEKVEIEYRKSIEFILTKFSALGIPISSYKTRKKDVPESAKILKQEQMITFAFSFMDDEISVSIKE